MGWLTGWMYRKSHEIIGSTSGAVTDYQIKIVVHYGSGTDSGEHVYLNGKCRTDFGDIRFTADDGETELPYWIERKVDGDYAIFWVKVPSIPASPDKAIIYIYYGNLDVTTTSNLTNTFLRVINDLVLAYPINEGSGSTIYDKSGGGYNGTIYGAVWVDTGDPKLDYALSFDGSNDYVTTPTGALDFPEFTVVVWLRYKYTSPPATWVGLVDKGRNNLKAWWLLSSKGDWRVVFGIGNGSTITEIYFGDMGDRKFHMLVGQFRNSDMLMRTWQDLNMTEQVKSITVVGSGQPIEIGRRTQYNGYYSYIEVASLRYYSRFLTQEEITDLYNHYPFEVPDNPEAKGKTLIRKFIYPEPSHGAWGAEETPIVYVEISDSFKAVDIVAKIPLINISDCLALIDYSELGFWVIVSDSFKATDVAYRTFIKTTVETVRTIDKYAKEFILTFLDIAYGEWVSEYFKGKAFYETIKGVDVISKTATLHREYSDIFKATDVAYWTFIKSLMDSFKSLDRYYKTVVKVLETESSVVGVPFREIQREARETITAIEKLFTKDILWNFIEQVLVTERPRKHYVTYFFDTIVPEFLASKGMPKTFIEPTKVVERMSKEYATMFEDIAKIKDIGAWWTFIKTFLERIFSDHDYIRYPVRHFRDSQRITDPIAKIAFTLTQLWTRRVYSRPEKFADIIEASDHNVRVDACKKLLDKIKKLKEKLESM